MSNDVSHTVTWNDIAPLVAQWQIALLPDGEGTWTLLTGYAAPALPLHVRRTQVPFTQIPQVVARFAALARAEALEGKGE